MTEFFRVLRKGWVLVFALLVVLPTIAGAQAAAGVIYAVMDNGDLMWYRHDGRNDGSIQWACNNGKNVGTGWNVKHVFSGGGGVIYAVMDNGDLKWNRHDGRGDGSTK